MKEESKKKKILKISGLIGLFLIVFGLSYALFTVTLNGTKKVKIKTGKLELQLLDSNNNPIYITDQNNTTSYEINLDNQVPVSDEVGLDSTAFEFKLKNTGNIKASYTIYLDDVALESGESRIDDEYIRYSLTKNGSEENPQSLSSRELDKGTIEADNTTNEYTLKIWIAEDATNDAMDKVFNATLRVEGSQYVAPESPYGTKIAETQLTETITATYYQPEGTGYNNENKVKRMSNVRKIDNETTYEGGTLVISGEGEMPDCGEDGSIDLILFLLNATYEEVDASPEKYIENGNFIYRFNPENLVIGEGITRIGNNWFKRGYPSIKNIDISNTVETIGKSAFEESNITSVIIPNNVLYVEEDAFYNCNSLKSVSVLGKNTTSGDNAFSSCDSLEVIKLNSEIVSEAMFSTSSGDNLREIYLSKNIKRFEYACLGIEYNTTVTIYCETQEVAAVFNNSFGGKESQVIVDPTKF